MVKRSKKHRPGIHVGHTPKRRLSDQEEFKIMGLVLDKFLWVGAAMFFWGLFVIITRAGRTMPPLVEGLLFILGGAALAAVFGWIIVKEFEMIR